MTAFVLDCSIAVAWCFADEASAAADALLDRLRDHGGVVPALWHLELGNVLTQAERRKRISAAHLASCLDLIADLPIATDDQTAARARGETLSLARALGLTTYDACYLEVAIRRAMPLATKDAALATAARNRGVAILAA